MDVHLRYFHLLLLVMTFPFLTYSSSQVETILFYSILRGHTVVGGLLFPWKY